ncbi:hypothetical protein N9052_00575 [bacterium]|nr:hypothetical protein [bacterium]
MSKQPKIAVCFFGITRSLSYTIESIRNNILSPVGTIGRVQIFGHFFDAHYIDNPRSEEHGALPRHEHSLIEFDHLALEKPTCEKIISQEEVAAFGDAWSDDFASLSNVISQLHSLHQVTEIAMSHSPEIIIFARPDLEYHDSLLPVISKAASRKTSCVYLPYWQPWTGYNDRFAVIRGRDAMRAYGLRGLEALNFCKAEARPLHAELLLKRALADARVKLIPQRAGRVRLGGKRHPENYKHPNEEALSRLISRASERLPFLRGRERQVTKIVVDAIYGDRSIE